jgi:hypothetical protein
MFFHKLQNLEWILTFRSQVASGFPLPNVPKMASAMPSSGPKMTKNVNRTFVPSPFFPSPSFERMLELGNLGVSENASPSQIR